MKFRINYFVLMTFFSIILTGGVALSVIFFPNEYHALAVEDGPIETLGALCFGLSSVIFMCVVLRSRIFIGASKLSRVMTFMWALLAFVAMGEEISWGQRILGLETPEAIKVEVYGAGDSTFSNVQNEINLHNMSFIHETIGNWRLTMGLLIFLGVFYPLSAFVSPIAALYRKFYVPINPIYYYGIAVGGYIVHSQLKFYAYRSNDTSETYEMFLGILFLTFSLHTWFRPRDVYLVKPTP